MAVAKAAAIVPLQPRAVVAETPRLAVAVTNRSAVAEAEMHSESRIVAAAEAVFRPTSNVAVAVAASRCAQSSTVVGPLPHRAFSARRLHSPTVVAAMAAALLRFSVSAGMRFA